MEPREKTEASSEQARTNLRKHMSESHPEIQCQCMECLYAREILAQCEVWKEIS